MLGPCKGSLPNVHRSQNYGTSFWEKKKKLYCKVDRQAGEKAKICLPDPGFGGAWRDFSIRSSWKMVPSLLKRFLHSDSGHVHVFWLRDVGDRGETVVPGIIYSIFSSAYFCCMTSSFVLLSMINKSVSCKKQDRASWSWFYSYSLGGDSGSWGQVGLWAMTYMWPL